MQHTLLYISLPLFCTTTLLLCKTKTWNVLVTHYFLCRNCRICSPKILLLVFLFAFIFSLPLIFTFVAVPCWPLAFLIFLPPLWNFHVFLPTKFASCVLITRSSSFSVITLNRPCFNFMRYFCFIFLLVWVLASKITSKKTHRCCFFSLKVQMAMRYPAKYTSSCLWCHTC